MRITASKISLFCIIILCAASFNPGLAKKKKRVKKKYRGVIIRKVEPKPAKPDSVVPVKIDTLPAPVTVPVPDWTGKKFRLLEKTKMFQNYGYELYTSPNFSKGTNTPDPQIEHDNHRLKYEVFNGRSITATAVRKTGKQEYHVTFKTDTFNLTVYGRTRKGIIEGLALYSDFTAAEKRWKDKVIFAKRRSIEIFDSLQSSFSSIKVPITEPLRVKAIRWGITPLPPKSLWLVILRPNGFSGFIPLNYSWTNVLRESDTEKLPWGKDIFEHNPKKLYTWENYIWETINKHNICTEMTTEQVRFSWGEPKDRKIEKRSDGKEITTYYYSGKSLTFINDTLKSTSE